MQIKPTATFLAEPFIFECSACNCIEHRSVPFMPLGWTFHEIDGADLALCADCSPDEKIEDLDLEAIEQASPDWLDHLERQAEAEQFARALHRPFRVLLISIALGLGITVLAQFAVHAPALLA